MIYAIASSLRYDLLFCRIIAASSASPEGKTAGAGNTSVSAAVSVDTSPLTRMSTTSDQWRLFLCNAPSVPVLAFTAATDATAPFASLKPDRVATNCASRTTFALAR